MAYHRQQGVDTRDHPDLQHLRPADAPARRPRDPDLPAPGAHRPSRSRSSATASQTRSFTYVDDLIAGHDRAGRVRRARAGQHRQPRRVHAARAGRDGHRRHRLGLGDRPRGAARPTTPSPPARHHPRPAAPRLGAHRSTLREGLQRTIDQAGRDVLVGAGTLELRLRPAGDVSRHAEQTSTLRSAHADAQGTRRRTSRAALGGAPCAGDGDWTPLPARRRARQAPAGARLPAAAGRRCGRPRASLSLLALDFAGDLSWRSSPRCASRRPSRDAVGPRRLARSSRPRTTSPFAVPGRRRCCSRARGCTPSAPQRPGLTRIVASLFQTMVVALVFAVVNGQEFSSYYIFYGSLFFAVAYVSTRALRLRAASRARCCAPPATSAARCSSARGTTSRPSPTR